MGLVTLVLWHLRDRFAPGVLFGLYLFLAGAERLLVEFIRRNDSVVAGLTLAQLFSLAMMALRSGRSWLAATCRGRRPPSSRNTTRSPKDQGVKPVPDDMEAALARVRDLGGVVEEMDVEGDEESVARFGRFQLACRDDQARRSASPS